MPSIPMGKTRKPDKPWLTFKSHDGSWKWLVLRSYQKDNLNRQHARWLCLVKTPYVPEGEYGDVYVSDILDNAVLVDIDPSLRADFRSGKIQVDVLNLVPQYQL